MYVVRQAMVLYPVDRLLPLPCGTQLAEILCVLRWGLLNAANHGVAEHALLYIGQPRCVRLIGRPMAELTLQARNLDVHAVIKDQGLFGGRRERTGDDDRIRDRDVRNEPHEKEGRNDDE